MNNLSQFLSDSENAAVAAGLGPIWKAEYQKARASLGLEAATKAANVACGLAFEAQDTNTVDQIRDAILARKLGARLTNR